MLIKLVDNLALVTVRGLIWLIQRLPERFAELLAYICIRVVFAGMPRADKVARRNLELVFPNKSWQEREEIRRESYRVLARNLLGYALIPKLTLARAKQAYSYATLLEVMAEVRKQHPDVGILFPTAHFGCFEQHVQANALLDRPIGILARGFGLPKLDAWWNARRELFGNEMFSRKGAYKEIVNRLSSGGDVTLLCDQNVKRNHAVFVELFGIPAATTKTVALAAMRTGAQIIFVTTIELENNTFELFVRRIPHPNDFSGTNRERVYQCTRAMHEALEEVVRLRPDHWFWVHRRYKTRPEGEPETMYQ